MTEQPDGGGPKVSVVICTRDRPLELERCLQNLREYYGDAVEVIVVDSSPRTSPASNIAAKYGARYLLEPRPGLSRARNAGAAIATGKIIAFLDDDAFPARDWLTKLLPEFEDESVAVVTGSILSSNAELESARTWDSLGGYRAAFDSRFAIDRNTPGWFNAAHFGAMGNGSNMAFRRAVFGEWVGFNEDLGRGHRLPGGEEHYAFFELAERGYRIVHRPDAIVYHPAPSTRAELEARFLQTLSEGGMYTLYVLEHLPRYRGEVYSLIRGYIRKQFARSPGKPQQLRGIGVSRFRQLKAVASGVLIYIAKIWRRKGTRAEQR